MSPRPHRQPRPLSPLREHLRDTFARHRALLVRAVETTVPEAAGRAFALRPDRQGIG